MSVSNLIGKMARGQKLSNLEIIALEQALQNMEQTHDVQGGWTQPGAWDAQFGSVKAKRIDLDVPPGNPFFAYYADRTGVTGNMIAVPHATYTALDFTEARYTVKKDNPCVVRLSGSKIYNNFPNAVLSLQGRIFYFETGTTTNNRLAGLQWFDSNDTLIETRQLNYIAATASSNVVFSSFKFSVNDLSSDPGQYFKFVVEQDSGVTLHVSSVELMLTLAYK